MVILTGSRITAFSHLLYLPVDFCEVLCLMLISTSVTIFSWCVWATFHLFLCHFISTVTSAASCHYLNFRSQHRLCRLPSDYLPAAALQRFNVELSQQALHTVQASLQRLTSCIFRKFSLQWPLACCSHKSCIDGMIFLSADVRPLHWRASIQML